MRICFSSPAISAAIAIILFAASPARAELLAFATGLSGDSAGAGEAIASYDTEAKTLSWHVVYDGLSGPPTAAHIHGPAKPGENAGILIAFDNPGHGKIDGSAVLSDEMLGYLKDGLLYVNIHTELHRGGEIRGYLQQIPAP